MFNTEITREMMARLAEMSWTLVVALLIQEQRRREFIRLEKQLEDDQRQQAILAAHAAANKNHLVQFVAKVRTPLLLADITCKWC